MLSPSIFPVNTERVPYHRWLRERPAQAKAEPPPETGWPLLPTCSEAFKRDFQESLSAWTLPRSHVNIFVFSLKIQVVIVTGDETPGRGNLLAISGGGFEK